MYICVYIIGPPVACFQEAVWRLASMIRKPPSPLDLYNSAMNFVFNVGSLKI